MRLDPVFEDENYLPFFVVGANSGAKGVPKNNYAIWRKSRPGGLGQWYHLAVLLVSQRGSALLLPRAVPNETIGPANGTFIFGQALSRRFSVFELGHGDGLMARLFNRPYKVYLVLESGACFRYKRVCGLEGELSLN